MSSYLGKPFATQELWKCLMNYLPVENFSAVDEQQQAFDYEALQKQLKFNFVKSNQNTFAEIKKAIGKSDIKLAHRLAHTLKTNAGQIGEKTLQEAAAAAEGMLLGRKNMPKPVTSAEPAGRPSLPEQLDILEAELNAVLEKLAPMLAEATAETKNKNAFLNTEETRELFERLEDMLKNRNPECVDLLDNVRAARGTEELVRLMESFNFKQALSELKRVMETTDGKER
jgi:HPt (histidine-containing phosphotransfer) domain-containing protein